MRLRVAAIVVAAACLLALAPYTIHFTKWQFDPANYPRMIVWAGCRAELHVSDMHSPAESFYDSLNHRMYVGTYEDDDIPYYAGLTILMHETGHCLQDQEGLLDGGAYGIDPVRYELDADRRSADLMCGLGLDGRDLLRQTFEWARDAFGYTGDPSHGSLEQRIAQGQKARACDVRQERWATR